MLSRSTQRILALVFASSLGVVPTQAVLAAPATTPDGRTIAPVGFAIPVGSFASSLALSPDGAWLAVLSQDDGAVYFYDSHASQMVDRMIVPSATAMTWTSDGLYVSCGYSGVVERFSFDADRSKASPVLARKSDLNAGPGLLNGVVEDPATHRVAVARSAEREVDLFDDATGAKSATLKTTGQPFAVAFAGNALVASLYDSDHVDAFANAAGAPVRIATGPHPTAMLADGARVYVANADGHDVAVVDGASMRVVRRIDLARSPDVPPGQTPSGMTLSDDKRTLFVAESGYDDVAVVDLASGRVTARIPTGWYPMAVLYTRRPTEAEKDPRDKAQLWIASAKGFGSQANPSGEDNDSYFGLVQHVLLEPARYAAWTAQVARNDGFDRPASHASLPPIAHVVFVVKENKHFDEEFGDDPRAHGDPALVLYGRKYTPNAHALADAYTLFDDFMGNGEASIYGHSWTTQGFANDYNERNGHSRSDSTDPIPRVAYSIWPYPFAGDDSLPGSVMDFDWYRNLADLPKGPRINVSGVFGPRGQLIDALQRHGVGFRVYGEQMRMLSDGAIAPGLAAHAARDYPGTHIDFGTLDTARASLFLADVRAHGLAPYSYVTLPTDHTAGVDPGFYTPASYVANNDVALGRIVAGLSRRPEWRSTVVFIMTDDPSGTGDHISGTRMPALVVGPYVRKGFVDHARYSIPSVLRTVEALFGVQPLSIFDQAATPMTAAFTQQPDVRPYGALTSNVAMTKNPGKAASTSFPVDGPGSTRLPREEWASVYGAGSLAAHDAYLALLESVNGLLAER